MTRDEVTAILAVLKTAYPTFYKNMSDDEIEDVIDLWATMFADDEVRIVTEAVRAYIATDTKGFPPVIGQIKEKIQEITQPKMMTEMEAWERVKRAISYYHATEAFANLPPILQKIVGSPNTLREWAVMDSETVNSVIQSNFMRSFKTVAEREREFAKLPESAKQLMIEASKNLKMIE